MKFLISKKGLSSLNATMIFILFAIFAVIGFQVWFYDYSSSLFADVEEGTQYIEFNIERLHGNSLYIRVEGEPFHVGDVDIRVGETECKVPNEEKVQLDTGLNSITIEGCLGSYTGEETQIIIEDDELFHEFGVDLTNFEGESEVEITDFNTSIEEDDVPFETQFDFEVTDSEVSLEHLDCTLFVKGESQYIGTCEELLEEDLDYTFEKGGYWDAILEAENPYGNQDEAELELFGNWDEPIIQSLDATSKDVSNKAEIRIDIEDITDDNVEGDDFECRLDFGDGESRTC